MVDETLGVSAMGYRGERRSPEPRSVIRVITRVLVGVG